MNSLCFGKDQSLFAEKDEENAKVDWTGNTCLSDCYRPIRVTMCNSDFVA